MCTLVDPSHANPPLSGEPSQTGLVVLVEYVPFFNQLYRVISRRRSAPIQEPDLDWMKEGRRGTLNAGLRIANRRS